LICIGIKLTRERYSDVAGQISFKFYTGPRMVLALLHMVVSALFSLVNMFKKLAEGDRGEAKRCTLHLSVAAQVSRARHHKCKLTLVWNII